MHTALRSRECTFSFLSMKIKLVWNARVWKSEMILWLLTNNDVIQWLRLFSVCPSFCLKEIHLSLHTPWTRIGEVEVYVHLLLTLALNGGELSTSRPGQLHPTGTNWIGGCVGTGTGTDFWKANTWHASTWIRSPDCLARKLPSILNTPSRVCPLFDTYYTFACTHTHCFYFILLRKTAKYLECSVYSYAKACLLKN